MNVDPNQLMRQNIPVKSSAQHGSIPLGRIPEHLHSQKLGFKILISALFALPLVMVSDISSNSGELFYFAKGIIAVLLMLTLILPIQRALALLLMLAVVGSDIGTADIDIYGNVNTTASIWQLYLGPLRPSWIIFGCIVFQFAKFKKKVFPLIVRKAILWFATIPFITGLYYGGFFGPHATTEVVIDLKFAFMLIASLVLFLSIFRRSQEFFLPVLTIFIGGLSARHLVDVLYVFLNLGPEITQGVTQGSLDSVKGAVIFLAYFGVTLFIIYKRWIVGSTLASFSVLLLAAYGTRMLWITFFIGAIVLLALFNLRRRALVICVASFLLFVGGWVLSITNPESAEIAYLRYLTITEGREFNKFSVEVEGNIISRIDPTRYGEMLNILDTTNDRWAYLWGSGYGGYYDDNVIPFPSNLGTTFPDYSFSSGLFYRAHDYLFHVFFKFGLIGLFLISSLWVIPSYELFKLLRKLSPSLVSNCPMIYSVMRCVVAFMPTAMLQLYWSGKGLFISGVLIAICIEFVWCNQVTSGKDEVFL